jgi:hypothetical protein
MRMNVVKSFKEEREEVRKRLEGGREAPGLEQPAHLKAGPRGDSHRGRPVTMYLRDDVIEWLHEEAKRRGNGMSPARLVVMLVRAEMALRATPGGEREEGGAK